MLFFWLLSLFVFMSEGQYVPVPRVCKANEEYLACGPSCQTECATLGQPCLIVNIRCPDGCYCVNGYARNAAGTCIPTSRCNPRY